MTTIGGGGMNRRVTFQRATIAHNAFNEEIETWWTLSTSWVNKADVSAFESLRAQEVGAQLGTRFTIRHQSALADLNPRDRLIYGGAVYNITGVREKQRNRWIEVDTVARPDIAASEVSP